MANDSTLAVECGVASHEKQRKRRSSLFDKLFSKRASQLPKVNTSDIASAQRDSSLSNAGQPITSNFTIPKIVSPSNISVPSDFLHDLDTGLYPSKHSHATDHAHRSMDISDSTPDMFQAQNESSEAAEPIIEPPTPVENNPPFSTQAPLSGKLRKSHRSSEHLRPRPTPIASPKSPEQRGRTRISSGTDLLPPPALSDIGRNSMRSASAGSPHAPYYHSDSQSLKANNMLIKRKSWLPGGKRTTSNTRSIAPDSWILGMDGGGIPYDSSILAKAEKVPELWDENGDILVFLHPQVSDKSPSFRVSSACISASRELIEAAIGPSLTTLARRRSFVMEESTRQLYIENDQAGMRYAESVYSRPSTASSSRAILGHLYFPGKPIGVTESDDEYLVSIRNLFAFLTCQPLVATKAHPTVFSAFNMVAAHLVRFGFTNMDGSSFGSVASASLAHSLEAYQLADMRHSREKTIEGLILGERLKCQELYNESFSLAVGRYDELLKLKSPLLQSVSATTRSRLERSWIDLEQRKQSVNLRIANFYFPALFAGSGASTSSSESKSVRYQKWKDHFLSFRKHFMSYQRHLYGSWPPQARSKKNNFSRSGLNRVVLRSLYFDLCTLYDVLVDRTSLTTRIHHGTTDDSVANKESSSSYRDPILISALRKLLEESDNSSPPVQPPMPFDTPKLPTIETLEPTFGAQSPKSQYDMQNRTLKDYERQLIIAKSHNVDSHANTPFLKWFFELEQHEARGKSAADMQEMRIGWWLFLYVVLQSLPMLCIDAPGLRYTADVETFLCIPVKGGMPWMDNEQVKKNWYSVQGAGGGKVQLPSDVIEYGIEGVYRRSHAWVMSEIWLGNEDGIRGDQDVQDWADSPITPGLSEHRPWSSDYGSGSERSRSRERNQNAYDYDTMDLSSPYHPSFPDHTASRLRYAHTGDLEEDEDNQSFNFHSQPLHVLPYQQLDHPSWIPPRLGGGIARDQSPSSNYESGPPSLPSSRCASPQPRLMTPQSQVMTPSSSSSTIPKQPQIVEEPDAKGFDDILNDMRLESGKENTKNGGKKVKKDKNINKSKGDMEKRKSFMPF